MEFRNRGCHFAMIAAQSDVQPASETLHDGSSTQTMVTNLPDLLATTIQHYQSGRFKQARSICLRILRHQPHHPEANHIFGLLAHQDGDNRTAVKTIQKAVSARPTNALYHFNLGVVLESNGDADAAIEFYRKAIANNPKFGDAHNNLGVLLLMRGNVEAAQLQFERATRFNAKNAEAWVNLGKTMLDKHSPAEALAHFECAVGLNSSLAEAHFGVGKCHEEQHDWKNAEISYRHALRLNPNFIEAQNNLGTALLAQGNYHEAQAVFRRLLELKHGTIRATSVALESQCLSREATLPVAERRILRHKLVDRVEQIQYLLERGLLDSSFERLVERCQLILGERNGAMGDYVMLPNEAASWVEVVCDSVIHFKNAPALGAGAVNPTLNFRKLEDEYLSTPTSVVCIDNFLRPEALLGLRNFSLESTIFFGADPAGYVTSYVGDGFNCSLLYQIAEDLKRCFPTVVGEQFLSNMWIYRHHEPGKGVDIHTDYGAVTFNFWFTPDVANLTPNRGGLVVYKKEEPLDWDWIQYNKNKNSPEIQDRIKSYLGSAETVPIPYRENRAVLFRSTLFHGSDEYRFRDGFENRRMNMSMLFGERCAMPN